MTPNQVLGWMEKGLARVAALHGRDPKQWWPESQSQATSWIWATLFEAARELDPEKVTTLCAPLGDPRASAPRRASTQVRDQMISAWRDEAPGKRFYWPGHDLLDFTFKRYDDPMPNVLAAESEMFPAHSTCCAMDDLGDYAWDFFKLLQVPALRRIMFARVGWRDRRRNASGDAPRWELFKGLTRMATHYAPQFIREGEEIAIVVMPELASEWSDIQCAVLRRRGTSIEQEETDRWPGWDPEGLERSKDGW